MDTKCYDLNICKLKKFYESVVEAWENWENKPKDPEIRLGILGEPTTHPEFLEILKKIKPKKYFTDGRIFGTPGDPRKCVYIDKTLESESKVILRWSDTSFCKKAFLEFKKSGIPLYVEILISKKEDIDRFWEKFWDETTNFLLTPKLNINQQQEVSITFDDLRNRKNVKITEYYQNILLTDKKIIVTENSINLKPIKVYDRI